jgi:hypothetical protein
MTSPAGDSVLVSEEFLIHLRLHLKVLARDLLGRFVFLLPLLAITLRSSASHKQVRNFLSK